MFLNANNANQYWKQVIQPKTNFIKKLNLKKKNMRHKDEHLVNRRLLFIWWTKKGTFYVVYVASPPTLLPKPLIPILGNPWPQH